MTKAERMKKADEDSAEYFAAVFEQAERETREREEWSRSEHSFAGTTMTGKEWGELADDLKREGPLRDWLVQRLMRDGQTKAQAEKKANKFADAAAIMAKPESEWTPAEREKMTRANNDPTFKTVMPELQQQRLNGPDALARRDISQSEQPTSAANRENIFASAPDLTGQYQVAVAATKPLDVPKISTAPVVLPPAPAGLEV